ncbi:hypothetical protein D8666_23270 [Ochrobactrum soli]|nr:hypothetical protein D8666_23270 [[Ochrobactrum] soli]
MATKAELPRGRNVDIVGFDESLQSTSIIPISPCKLLGNALQQLLREFIVPILIRGSTQVF